MPEILGTSTDTIEVEDRGPDGDPPWWVVITKADGTMLSEHPVPAGYVIARNLRDKLRADQAKYA